MIGILCGEEVRPILWAHANTTCRQINVSSFETTSAYECGQEDVMRVKHKYSKTSKKKATWNHDLFVRKWHRSLRFMSHSGYVKRQTNENDRPEARSRPATYLKWNETTEREREREREGNEERERERVRARKKKKNAAPPFSITIQIVFACHSHRFGACVSVLPFNYWYVSPFRRYFFFYDVVAGCQSCSFFTLSLSIDMMRLVKKNTSTLYIRCLIFHGISSSSTRLQNQIDSVQKYTPTTRCCFLLFDNERTHAKSHFGLNNEAE